MRCYRLGEFGQVYPLARGTSPWLVAIGAAIFVHEQLSVDACTVGGYAGWLFLLQGPVLPVAALVARRGLLLRQVRPHLRRGSPGGCCT
ncbi:hypothetical protein BH10ACT10_BH10ACT10_20960 [soil metagenome]